MTEADLMAAHLLHTHGIEQVLLERASTNCGNNVTLARELATSAMDCVRAPSPLCKTPPCNGAWMPSSGGCGRTHGYQQAFARRAGHVAT